MRNDSVGFDYEALWKACNDLKKLNSSIYSDVKSMKAVDLSKCTGINVGSYTSAFNKIKGVGSSNVGSVYIINRIYTRAQDIRKIVERQDAQAKAIFAEMDLKEQNKKYDDFGDGVYSGSDKNYASIRGKSNIEGYDYGYTSSNGYAYFGWSKSKSKISPKENSKIWSSWYGNSGKAIGKNKSYLLEHLPSKMQDAIKARGDKLGKRLDHLDRKFEDNNRTLVTKVNKANKAVDKWCRDKQKWLDDKLDGTKLGEMLKTSDKNWGSKNDYKLGKNWKYANTTLYSQSVQGEWAVAGVGGKVETNGKYGSAYAQGDVAALYAKANASCTVTPGAVKVSAGAEASLLHATGSAGAKTKIGNAEFGAKIDGKVDVAHVYAEGSAGFGCYKGKDGKTHIDAGIQAKIGADLVSATATGTIETPIGDISGSATVKVGIGAQADIGLQNGKLNVHIGVAVGVGVELGFSVDLTKTIDGAKEIAKTASGAVKNAYNNTKDAIKSGAEAVGKFFSGIFG